MYVNVCNYWKSNVTVRVESCYYALWRCLPKWDAQKQPTLGINYFSDKSGNGTRRISDSDTGSDSKRDLRNTPVLTYILNKICFPPFNTCFSHFQIICKRR